MALRWRDVDLAEGIVRIERGVVMGPSGLVEKDTKTHAARRVALDDGTVQLIAAHRARMAARAAIRRVELSDDAFVFSNSGDGSESWFPDSVTRRLKRLCVAEGLPGARLHDLRHFVASQLLSAGVDVRTVAGRLGHRNAATTLNVYAHFLEQADRSRRRHRPGDRRRARQRRWVASPRSSRYLASTMLRMWSARNLSRSSSG